MMRSRLATMLTVGFILCFGTISAAQATVILQVERLNDTQAIIHGSGSVAPGTPPINPNLLSFSNPFTVDPVTSLGVLTSSSMTIGGQAVTAAFQAAASTGAFGGAAGFYFGFSPAISVGDTIAGSISVTLLGGATWGAVGTTGDVLWGVFSTRVPTGSYEIVSEVVSEIPEPGALAIFGLSLAGLGFVRRKRAA